VISVFTPAQSIEIDDRIVAMVVAAFGEGDGARRCRAIANERYLDSAPQPVEIALLFIRPQAGSVVAHD
jgi:hypothetical protein